MEPSQRGARSAEISGTELYMGRTQFISPPPYQYYL